MKAREAIFNTQQRCWWDGAHSTEEDSFIFPPVTRPKNESRRSSGKKNQIISTDQHGYYFRASPALNRITDLAFDATIRAAAPYQKLRHKDQIQPAILIKRQDMMNKVRIRRTSDLILFLVDLSWSMAVVQRMAAAKGAILSLLTTAYQKREKVGLITFQKDHADIMLQPTNSVMLAERAMKNVPIGGKTPLAAGLMKSYEVLSREKIFYPDINSMLIVLTDGAGNVSLYGGDPMKEAYEAADKIAEEGFHSIVINTEQITFGEGLANRMAEHLKAPCFLSAGLKAEDLCRMINDEKKR